MESAPRPGPTDRSSRTISGAGNAPARKISASSFVSATLKLPVIWPLPKICDWITGAETTLLSRTIAKGRPIFSPVTRPKRRAPSAFSWKFTAGRLFWSNPAEAFSNSSPLTITRFSTIYSPPPSSALSSNTLPGGTRPELRASCAVERISTSWKVSLAVRPIRRLMRSGLSTPGNCTRIRSLP